MQFIKIIFKLSNVANTTFPLILQSSYRTLCLEYHLVFNDNTITGYRTQQNSTALRIPCLRGIFR